MEQAQIKGVPFSVSYYGSEWEWEMFSLGTYIFQQKRAPCPMPGVLPSNCHWTQWTIIWVLNLKAVLHRTTCNVDFSCHNVVRKIEHHCEFLNSNKKLATRCPVKCWAKNCLPYHVTWCSIFRATLLSEKSTLQVVPRNTTLKLIFSTSDLSWVWFRSWPASKASIKIHAGQYIFHSLL